MKEWNDIGYYLHCVSSTSVTFYNKYAVDDWKGKNPILFKGDYLLDLLLILIIKKKTICEV